jgi:hypothetical protein
MSNGDAAEVRFLHQIHGQSFVILSSEIKNAKYNSKEAVEESFTFHPEVIARSSKKLKSLYFFMALSS